MKPTTIKCHLCGKKGARVRKVTQTYGRGADEYLVRNVPLIRCPNCYESYFTAATLHELESIKTHHRRLTVKRQVAVTEFPKPKRRRAG